MCWLPPLPGNSPQPCRPTAQSKLAPSHQMAMCCFTTPCFQQPAWKSCSRVCSLLQRENWVIRCDHNNQLVSARPSYGGSQGDAGRDLYRGGYSLHRSSPLKELLSPGQLILWSRLLWLGTAVQAPSSTALRQTTPAQLCQRRPVTSQRASY